MTTSYPLEPSLGGRSLLCGAAVRARLAALVRRRVPPGEAEDVVQSVLCDALAAPRIPADPTELSRWIAVLARNKIADFHRGARRRAAQELPELTVPPAPFEARALLDHIVHDTPFDARGREALDWVLREHAGEPLEEIARRAALPSTQVRKRVSRLRARLRQAWLGDAAAVALVALAFGAVAVGWRAAQAPVAIVSEPAIDGPAAAALGRLQGVWHIEAMTPAPSLDATMRAFAEAQAPSVRIEIEGRRMRVQAPAVTRERFLDGRETPNGRWALEITDGAGGTQQAEAELRADGRLVVRSAAGRWQGTITLAR